MRMGQTDLHRQRRPAMHLMTSPGPRGGAARSGHARLRFRSVPAEGGEIDGGGGFGDVCPLWKSSSTTWGTSEVNQNSSLAQDGT